MGTLRAAAGLALVALVLGVTLAPAALGDEPPRAEAAPRAEAKPAPKGLSEAALLEWIFGHPASRIAFLLLAVGMPSLGITFLVLAYLRRDKIRGGLLPAPEPVEPTVPFAPLPAFGLYLGVHAAMVLVGDALARARPEHQKDLRLSLLLTFACTFPLAVLVVLRRLRLAAPPPPRPAAAARTGLRAWAVATVFTIPAGLVTMFLLKELGQPPTTQPLIEQVVAPKHAWEPWAIALYGVIGAPILEEATYRGLLHPAVRTLAGGGARGGWVATIVVAALFAAVHMHLPALPGLFALAIVLGRTFEGTNSLLATTVAHAAFNLGSLTPLLLGHLR